MNFNENKMTTIDIIKAVQTTLGLVPDGDAGAITWNAIATNLGIFLINPPITPTISDAAYKLILKYEVGGGEQYYNAALKHPEYPGGESGVTIGVGYDLGFSTSQQFESDWKKLLSPDVFNTLSKHIGKKGDAARAVIHDLKDIVVPWSAAETVFKTCDIPRYSKETISAFPGCDKLKPDAFGVLVSLVFNRGGSVIGSSRQEMLNIKNAISGTMKTDNIYSYIANQLIAMKRLWVGKSLNGLLERRDAEAALVRSCVL